jgi:hypothetical protein
MQGEPDRGFVGRRPFDAVAAVGGDVEPITGVEDARLRFVVEAERGGAAEQDDPFVGVLVVPLALGCGMTARDDALEACVGGADQDFEQLVGQALWHIGEEIVQPSPGEAEDRLAVLRELGEEGGAVGEVEVGEVEAGGDRAADEGVGVGGVDGGAVPAAG